jgi:general secretion pathway protein G
MAIDEFRRDTVGINCSAAALLPGGGGGGGQLPPPAVDPRSRVVISDCTIFGVDNPDMYPPDLETLVNGVNVIPRGMQVGGDGKNDDDKTSDLPKLGSSQLSTKQKVYLRALPIDPMTGKADWELRSSYDPADAGSWGGENVFDVRSKSKGTALNGEKYSDW